MTERSRSSAAVKANQLLEVSYDKAVRRATKRSRPATLFNEETVQLMPTPFKHRENDFNEYKEQILLPHMFSKSGPFISTGDVDGRW